jgi:hypothetical protein
MIDVYVRLIRRGTLTLDDVPAASRADVQTALGGG